MKWIQGIIAIGLMNLVANNAFAELQRGIQGHTAGDVIALQTDSDVAAWCDFNKQILLTHTNVLCVYNGKK